VGRCLSALMASTFGLSGLRCSQVYLASDTSRTMVTEEPQNAHLDSRGRATPDAPPASSYFESVQPRSRLARTRVTYKVSQVCDFSDL
jgi:hypothetical protein